MADLIAPHRHNELAGTMQQMLPGHTEPARKKWSWPRNTKKEK